MERKNPALAPKPPKTARRARPDGKRGSRIVYRDGIPVFTGPLPEEVRNATPAQLKDMIYDRIV